MSDDVDRTGDRTENDVSRTIDLIRRVKALEPKGRCYYCDQDIGAVRLFCNQECSADFEAEQRQRARAGRR